MDRDTAEFDAVVVVDISLDRLISASNTILGTSANNSNVAKSATVDVPLPIHST
jgi:hypothetical protein